MAKLPVRDRAGNVLTGVRLGAAEDLRSSAAVTASLVVAVHADAVLMVFDSWRRQWEIPGGTREQGETTLETAARELAEETGIQKVNLSFAALADFLLADPERRETLAVYRCRLSAVPVLVPNNEILDFRWWSPSDRLSGDMSPLDAEIGRRVYRQLTLPGCSRHADHCQ